MSFALIEVELTKPTAPVRLDADQTGIAIVLRRCDRIVGYSMHDLPAGATLSAAEVEALFDPSPRDDELHAEGDPPTITIAVCTRDRPELLTGCLSAVASLTPPPHEVLVVDNAPTTDATQHVVDRFGVRYEREPVAGLDIARNRALRAATGDVIAFIDDDAVPDRHWLSALRDGWTRHPDAGAFTGQILPLELETSAQVAFERRGGFRGGNNELRYEGMDLPDNPIYPYAPGMFGAGANMSVRRAVAMQLGGFDDALDTGPPLAGGGDVDFMHRVIRAGHPLVYDPAAVVFHRHRRDPEGLRRQYVSWGRSMMAFATKTYRRDRAGRTKVRRFLRWFFVSQVRAAARGLRDHDEQSWRAAADELRGGLNGLAAAYPRSARRIRRRRRAQARASVMIIPWGDVVEDYTEPLGMSVDDYVTTLSGGWLFGFVNALARVEVDSTIVVWSWGVTSPTRYLHPPSGAVIWVLPAARLLRSARKRLADRWATDRRGAIGERRGTARVAAMVARALVPYLTATPLRLSRLVRNEAPTAILCQEYEEGRFDVCVALGRVTGTPVYATFQGGDLVRTRLERVVRPRSVRASAGLVIHDEREIRRVEQRYGIAHERIRRIPNPFDPTTLPLVDRDAARAALGIDGAERVIAWHGRIDVLPKGIDVLVDAWEILQRSRGPVRLRLLGTGSGSAWLADALRDRQLPSVSWRNEYVLDRRVVGQHLSAADIYVLPSRQEGLPVAIIEAMAAALPVVAADAPGVRSVVGSGPQAAGVVVPVEDPPSLASALQRLLDDTELARSLGAAGRRRVEEEFGLAPVGEALRSFMVDDS